MSGTVTDIFTCPVTLEIISQLTFAPRRQRQERNSWYTKGPRRYFYLACAPRAAKPFILSGLCSCPVGLLLSTQPPCFCFSLLIITNPVLTGLFRKSLQLFFRDASPRSGPAVVLNNCFSRHGGLCVQRFVPQLKASRLIKKKKAGDSALLVVYKQS